jgi:hypothetical protein
VRLEGLGFTVTINTVYATRFIYYPLLEDVLLLRHVSVQSNYLQALHICDFMKIIILTMDPIRCFFGGESFFNIRYLVAFGF